MHRIFIGTVVLLILSVPERGLSQQTMIPVGQLQEDFRIFRGALEEMHPGLYWYASKKEMDGLFECTRTELDHDMTDLVFFRKLTQVISKIGCGHTWIAPAMTTSRHMREKGWFLPFDIRIIDGRAYLFHNRSNQLLEMEPGAEILKIDQYPIASLLTEFDDVLSSDGNTSGGKSKILEAYFNWFYAIHYDQRESYPITYLDTNGKLRNTQVRAIKGYRRFSQGPSTDPANITSRVLDKETLLLRIKQFDNWKEGGKKKRFAKILKQEFKKIDAADFKNVILDLRGNDGGAERLGLKLLSFFMQDPVVGYRQIRFKNTKFQYRKYSKTNGFTFFLYKALLKHKKVNDTTYLLVNDKNLKPVPPSEPVFSGKVYVLIDGGTYSTAADFSALMYATERATFIGQETGGGYNGNSSNFEFEFVLPNSKVRFNVPIAQYLTNVPTDETLHGRGTLPDHPVRTNITDLLQGVDPVLEYTKKLIQNQ